MGWNQQNVFTILIVSGGPGSGLFVYSPSPGLGNLVGSFTGSAGTDPYGNSFPAGLFATEGTFSGSLIAGIISSTPIGGSSITTSDFSQGTIETTVITLNAAGGQVFAYGSTTNQQTFNTTGTITFPAGVTSARVQCWGAAGGTVSGLSTAGPVPGAGGGEYAEEPALVVHAALYNVTVGLGGAGAGGAAGTSSSFPGDAVTVTANGGAGAPAGVSTGGRGGHGSTNSIHFDGGSGGNVNFAGTHGGGGGSSAGTSSVGNNGAAGSAGGAGGAAPAGGGAGGNGGTNGNPGTAGTAPGGAPGGSGKNGTPSLTGSNGRVVITYQTNPANLIAAIAATAGTDANANAYGAGFTGNMRAFQPGVSPTAVETWHTFTALGYQNGWLDGANAAGQYRLDGAPFNSVSLAGSLAVPVGFASGQVIVTVPAAYRPANTQNIPARDTTGGSNKIVWLTLGSAGNVIFQQTAGTVAAADNLIFGGRIYLDL